MEKYNNAQKSISVSVGDVQNSLFKKSPYIITIVICFFLVGLGELFQADFTWKVFIEPRFWISMVTTNIACLLAQWSEALCRVQEIEDTKLKDKTSDLSLTTQALKELNSTLSISDDIGIFVDEVNLERKIKKYKLVYGRKLQKMLDKSTDNQRRDYALFISGETTKKTRYIKKRLRLEEKLTDNYINENIKHTKIKYNKISLKMIKFGNASLGKGEEDDMPISKEKLLSERTLPARLRTIAIVIFFSSSGVSDVLLTWTITFKLISKLFGFIYSIISGRNEANYIVQNSTIHNMQVSMTWLKKYKKWKDTRIVVSKKENINDKR